MSLSAWEADDTAASTTTADAKIRQRSERKTGKAGSTFSRGQI